MHVQCFFCLYTKPLRFESCSSSYPVKLEAVYFARPDFLKINRTSERDIWKSNSYNGFALEWRELWLSDLMVSVIAVNYYVQKERRASKLQKGIMLHTRVACYMSPVENVTGPWIKGTWVHKTCLLYSHFISYNFICITLYWSLLIMHLIVIQTGDILF